MYDFNCVEKKSTIPLVIFHGESMIIFLYKILEALHCLSRQNQCLWVLVYTSEHDCLCTE